MMCEIFDGHLLVLSVRTIEPVALSRRHISLHIHHTGIQYNNRLELECASNEAGCSPKIPEKVHLWGR